MLAQTGGAKRGDGGGMAGSLGERAGERDSFLGGAGASIDPEQETMPHGGTAAAGGAANMRARTSRRRWREDGLAELLEESPDGARGDRSRSECEPCMWYRAGSGASVCCVGVSGVFCLSSVQNSVHSSIMMLSSSCVWLSLVCGCLLCVV